MPICLASWWNVVLYFFLFFLAWKAISADQLEQSYTLLILYIVLFFFSSFLKENILFMLCVVNIAWYVFTVYRTPTNSHMTKIFLRLAKLCVLFNIFNTYKIHTTTQTKLQLWSSPPYVIVFKKWKEKPKMLLLLFVRTAWWVIEFVYGFVEISSLVFNLGLCICMMKYEIK